MHCLLLEENWAAYKYHSYNSEQGVMIVYSGKSVATKISIMEVKGLIIIIMKPWLHFRALQKIMCDTEIYASTAL